MCFTTCVSWLCALVTYILKSLCHCACCLCAKYFLTDMSRLKRCMMIFNNAISLLYLLISFKCFILGHFYMLRGNNILNYIHWGLLLCEDNCLPPTNSVNLISPLDFLGRCILSRKIYEQDGNFSCMWTL